MAERLVRANGVEICTEPFGDPSDPPVLLMMGLSGSMIWWDEAFCEMLAAGGRFVIRYDQRDTGMSVTYPAGRPGYTGADLVADAVGLLDAYAIHDAHVVGVSAGGALAQVLAIDHPDRVRSLVLISTSPAVGDDRARLPGPSQELTRFWGTPAPDPADRARPLTTSSPTSAFSQAGAARSTTSSPATSCAATWSAPGATRPSRTTS